MTPQTIYIGFRNLGIFTLVFWLYYLALYQIVFTGSYTFWLKHAALIKHYAPQLRYLVPASELTLAALLLFPATRRLALTCIILFQFAFIAWVSLVFYATPYLVWPWQRSFGVYNWWYKFLESLLVAWLAYTCLRLDLKNLLFRNKDHPWKRDIAEHPLKK